MVLLLCHHNLWSQKPALQMSDFNQWQSIKDFGLSNNGNWIAYSISVQEGDGFLGIQQKNSNQSLIIERGYNFVFSSDQKFIIVKVKPTFKTIRDQLKAKTSGDLQQKDSLFIIRLSDFQITKIGGLMNYQLSKTNSILAVLIQENTKTTTKTPDSLSQLNSWKKELDSLNNLMLTLKNYGFNAVKKSPNNSSKDAKKKDILGTLLIFNLEKNTRDSLLNIQQFNMSEDGFLLSYLSENNKQKSYWISTSTDIIKNTIRVDTISLKIKQVLIKKNQDASTYFVAYLSTNKSQENEFAESYQLHYYNVSNDLQQVKHSLLNDSVVHQKLKSFDISVFSPILVNQSGTKIFFGLKRTFVDKDTSIADLDRVSLDIWHYKDDYIQPYQLKNLDREKKRSFVTVYDLEKQDWFMLQDSSSDNDKNLISGDEQVYYYMVRKNKISSQWEGFATFDIYTTDLSSYTKTKIKTNSRIPLFQPSANGDYVVAFCSDKTRSGYELYNAATKTFTPLNFPVSMVDEENDVPDDANPYGVSKFFKDNYILIYDRYDCWLLDILKPNSLTKITQGRTNKNIYRLANYINDPLETKNPAVLSINVDKYILTQFNELNKKSALFYWYPNNQNFEKIIDTTMAFTNLLAIDKNNKTLLFGMENFSHSPNLFYTNEQIPFQFTQLTHTNKQQMQYNWGTVELFNYKSLNQHNVQGLLFKPENFNPNKKYPLIVYFYERYSDNLFHYIEPAPTPSRLNISFMVSNGYIVFVPDIYYQLGYPGQSAYNYILGGVNKLQKYSWIDSNKMALQGQSWGGYQIAYLITRTNKFACAWAGAPVVNMFSAYGGIRWGTGLNRQFQYEKQQSRIGGTPWNKTQLFIENSPLFKLPNVQTPIVIMHNDADDAVPWYQGIEMFTDLRRLGKAVWMLNYNGEAHNLIERKNRKDITRRELEFFDFYLKDKGNPNWLLNGIPAIQKFAKEY